MLHIDFENPPDNENWPIPYKVLEYYMEHNYSKDTSYGSLGRPLDLELAREIFDVLKGERGTV